ncbi:23S rRNA (uracil(1939)-C(5))-methyltransferase RlmD [Cohnella zeiphila]|uniref:23S rRNA (Uracil(1939)-C(5))-methyltransferase RlmD n=1 Tax=Cohnella zeiphila TaxID=2761120 RepID=A0A7X0SQ00_9BACL|nr:23S rRNA (uracil(1939)-C(5))-methyltransferase RlmD [Cohnella zeiphila]
MKRQHGKRSGAARNERRKAAGERREDDIKAVLSGDSKADHSGDRKAARNSLPVQTGQSVDLDIVGLTHEGEGVGRVQGYTLFVRGALPGDRARAEVVSVGKSFGRARLTELLADNPDRRSAPCPIYDACGGCQLQHWDYAAQLRWKRQLIADNLSRIGKLPVVFAEDAERGSSAAGADSVSSVRASDSRTASDSRPPVIVHPVIGMEDPWRYRNKAQVPIGSSVEGGLISGFYEQGSHDIVDMDACLIQQEPNEETVRAVKAAAQSLGYRAYDRATGRGQLRHVVVRHAQATGERMVVLVTNGRDLPHADELVALIREAVPGLASICQNINTAPGPVVFGDETRVLWGRDVIYDEIGGIRFAISARSFFQVNPTQTERLYRAALDYAALTGDETVFDAYCGIGTITLFLAQHARRVYGVEIVPEAIEDARRNATINGIANTEFAVGAAEDILPRWQAEGLSPDVIVVDPPRKGCDPRLLDTMLQLRPERIVYVSCNPSTLARDLRVLEDGGYRTVEVQGVDMFPHTTHVECCSLLVWNGK